MCLLHFVCRFKNVQFGISSTEEPGVFEVTAKFLGVDIQERVELVFQVSSTITWKEVSTAERSLFYKYWETYETYKTDILLLLKESIAPLIITYLTYNDAPKCYFT